MIKKKDLIYITILLVTSTLLLYKMFHNGVYYSHDGEIHIARFAQSRIAIHDGQLPVRWLGNWNSGYGYPAFMFIYSLPYYIGSVFKISALSYEEIFKSLLLISLSFSSITFYLFAKRFGNELSAFIGAIFYISAPYRFANIYERGALGESLAFVFIPLLFITPYIFVKNQSLGFIYISITTFLLITTHAIVFAIFLLPFIIYCVFVFDKKKILFLNTFLAIIFGFLLSSFQWLPMIFEQKYVDLNKTYFNLFEGHFISVYQLLRIPNDKINTGTGIQFGSAQMLILLLSFIMVVRQIYNKQKVHKIQLFFMLSSLLLAFLTLDVSRPAWLAIKPLQTLLFPWRFLAFTTFSTAVIATIIFSRLKNFKYKFIVAIILLFIAIFPSRHFLNPSRWYSHNDSYYEQFSDPQKLDSYFLPKDANRNLDQLQIRDPSIVKGRGVLTVNRRKSNLLELDVNLSTASKVQLHTLSFPGWVFYLDGQKSSYTSNNYFFEGVIVASVPEGVHELKLILTKTRLMNFSDSLTLVSFGLLMLFVLYSQFFKKAKQVL